MKRHLRLSAFLVLAGCSNSPPQPPHPIPPSPPSRHKTAHIIPRTTPTPEPPRTPPSPTKQPQDDLQRIPSAPIRPPQLTEGQPPRQIADGAPSSAAEWRFYAERCLAEQNFPEASRAFGQEAKIYRKTDPQAASVEELKAARYSCHLEVYRRVKPEDRIPLERLEPTAGCYVGAFIDRDDRLASHPFGSQIFGDIAHFNSLTDKKHASFFTYLRYGNPFPTEWAEYVKENGAICHLAWEPDSLDDVKDDEYLRNFVAQLKAYDHPVILRFAGEMNGEWTPYHKDPGRYKSAFRLVYRLTRECPKVALLWCPNAVPAENIDAYYPGDDGCDWVGVNLYSVLFIDNNPKTPGDWINPIDLLGPVYQTYSKRKPIAIGEYAASHRAACVPSENVPFAQLKMAQLYSNLPLRYPRVKMVNWYDCNNILKARAGRQLNDYQLTDSSHLLETYEAQVNNGYFLGPQEQAAWQAAPLSKNQVMVKDEELKLHFFARCHIPNPILYLKIDKQWRWRGQFPTPLSCNVGRLAPGTHKLEVKMADLQGHSLQTAVFMVQVR